MLISSIIRRRSAQLDASHQRWVLLHGKKGGENTVLIAIVLNVWRFFCHFYSHFILFYKTQRTWVPIFASPQTECRQVWANGFSFTLTVSVCVNGLLFYLAKSINFNFFCIFKFTLQPSVRPKIKVQNQLVNAHVGETVELVCHCEAYPKPLVTWITPGGTPVIAASSMLSSTPYLNYTSSSSSSSASTSSATKYEIEEDYQGYRTTMKLKINAITTEDFGGWKCLSKNTLGEKEGLIRLYGK